MILLNLALAAVALTAVIRALLPLTWALVKPFSCDLCMSFWTGALVTTTDAVAHRIPPAGLHALFTFALERVAAVIGLAFVLNLVASWLRDARGAATNPLAGDARQLPLPLPDDPG